MIAQNGGASVEVGTATRARDAARSLTISFCTSLISVAFKNKIAPREGIGVEAEGPDRTPRRMSS